MKRPGPTQRSQPSIAGSETLLAHLNAAQREAVTTTEGPVLVLAGAGTGKTRVITYRIAHLLSRGVSPGAILAVTFTNKAAREMRERVAKLLGKPPEGLVLSTFHSLGARILRVEARHLGYRGNFNVYDTSDQVALLRSILHEIRGEKAPDPRAVLAAISRAKNRFLLAEELAAEAGDEWESLVALAYERYQSSLQAMNCVDFDDLIFLPARLLEREEEIAKRYRERFRYILVDEYQDTNGAQYRFLRSLVGPGRNLCVVGDDDQSIYSFRGAEVDKILSFERDFPGARVVKLEENYRSTRAILDLANAVISQSPRRHQKTLRGTVSGGAAVRWVAVGDEAEEVDFVLGEVSQLHRDGAPWSSMAILMRAANQARPFEEKLRLRRIPYSLVGGQSYFDRKEVRDVLAYWMVAVNPWDDFSLLRILNVPRRGIGSAAVRKLDELARASRVPILEALRLAHEGAGDFPGALRTAAGHVVQLFDRARERLSRGQHAAMARKIVEEASYAEAVTELYHDPLARQGRWAAVEELLGSVERWERERGGGAEGDGESFADFVAALRLDQEDPQRADGKREAAERRGLTLMTLHSAKGLEFPRVYLVGVEDDLIPHRKAQAEGDAAVDEERRLFYVGITRAREALTITHARARSAHGRVRERSPSRFLLEVAGSGSSGTSLLEKAVYDSSAEASAEDVEGFLDQYRKLRR